MSQITEHQKRIDRAKEEIIINLFFFSIAVNLYLILCIFQNNKSSAFEFVIIVYIYVLFVGYLTYKMEKNKKEVIKCE
jgi:Ca2+/Na+ antiporter